MSHWFPRPESPADLFEISGDFTADNLYALLRSAQAQEWKDKVGVRGLQEGSAKTSTRLLASSGWVFKTDRHAGLPTLAAASAALENQVQRQSQLGLYHPQKCWFVLHCDELFYPVSVCPQLQTLRSISGPAERIKAWLEMYRLGLEVFQIQQVELDLNPANFAFGSNPNQLYYLDDEYYLAGDYDALGLALAHRFSEEQQFSSADWKGFGQAFRQLFRAQGLNDYQSLGAFLRGLEDYPLRGAAPERLQSFLKGFHTDQKQASVNSSKHPRRICILGDIHANLAALETVLEQAKEIGVSGYLILGDTVGYGPQPNECIARLADLPNLQGIRGNHDQALLHGEAALGMRSAAQQSLAWTLTEITPASRTWLAQWPDHWRDGKVMAVHGSLIDPEYMYGYIYEMTYEANLQKAREMGLSVLFYGHSHFSVYYRHCTGCTQERLPQQSIRLFEPDTTLLINPGSVGQPRDRDPRTAFAIWDQDAGQVHFLRQQYPIAKTVKALAQTPLDPRLGKRLLQGV